MGRGLYLLYRSVGLSGSIGKSRELRCLTPRSGHPGLARRGRYRFEPSVAPPLGRVDSGYVRIFAQPRQADERILKAWRKISEDLRRDWSVEEMAATAMMCGEHFRRLCLKTFGRSPMMHLSLLRIQRAEELLRSTDQKIEAICDEIGYEYRSTFSNIFTKLVGMRPSVYRNATRALSGGIQAELASTGEKWIMDELHHHTSLGARWVRCPWLLATASVLPMADGRGACSGISV